VRRGLHAKVADALVGGVGGDPDWRLVAGHYKRAEAAIRKIRAAGALPITIGGDHGIPIPIFRALDGEGPITLVQIDAHLDWRDNVNGVREGYSSPIRRASEMAHIAEIFQLGIRGQGSARVEEVEAARAYGSNIVTANEWQDIGTAALLERIPAGGRYYLTIDADGLDPAVMPAVEGPAPGGISYRQTIELIKGLFAKGRVVGMDIVEIAPARDVNEITSMTAGLFISMPSALRCAPGSSGVEPGDTVVAPGLRPCSRLLAKNLDGVPAEHSTEGAPIVYAVPERSRFPGIARGDA